MEKSMSNENNAGGGNANPDKGAAPIAPVVPPNQGGAPNSDDAFKKLQEEHETLKRQYKGSSDEALRLKQENEELKKQTATRKPATPENDQAFQKIVEEKGFLGALKHVVEEVVSPLAAKTETLFGKEEKSALTSFKANHPGLTGELETKFNEELERQKKVSASIDQAMESAYRIVSGSEADAKAQEAAKAEKEKQDLAKKSEEDKAKLEAGVSGGSKDGRQAPVNPNAALSEQISQLQTQAYQKEANGQDATEIFVRIEQLKNQLAAKSV
jgi:hypothetical protein